MEQSILQMYERSLSSNLTKEDADWLERKAGQYAYFALPHRMLARYHRDQASAGEQKMLRKAAGYSPSRALLRNYMLNLTRPSLHQPVPEMETIGTADQPAVSIQDSTPHLIDTLTAAIESPAPEAPVTAVQPEVLASGPIVVDSPPKAPVQGINWFLDTRISLRSGMYAALSASILKELQQYRSTLTPLPGTLTSSDLVVTSDGNLETLSGTLPVLTEDGLDSLPEPMITGIEVPPQREEFKTELEVIAENVFTEEVEYQSSAEELPAEHAEIITQTESSLPSFLMEEDAEGEIVRPLEFTSRGLDFSRKITSVSSIIEPSVDDIPGTGYEIGSFSSFMFTDENEVAEAQLTRTDANEVHTRREDDEFSEIIVDEGDRIVEVRVSKWQMDQLFTIHPDSYPVQNQQVERETPAPQPKRKEMVEQIIDRFIEAEPSISRLDKTKTALEDLARTSYKEEEEMVTETLAWIHARQGNLSKAIRMYEKLMLRFPEKSNYFADLISKLRK